MADNNVKIEEFFEDEFPNFAIYNLYRMVASYVDGLKPSQRKVVYTVMKQNINSDIKVNRLGSKVSEATEYLHGEDNLQGVIVGMAQNFTGTNNVNMLSPESSFGNRCFPQAAAARYIYTKKAESFDLLFNKSDNALLIEQEFEGTKIEPRFFLPTLPLILLNGVEGIGSGWSQKILPRNPGTLKKAIKNYLSTGKLPDRIRPWYRGFKGTIEHIENNVWEICGSIEVKNTTTIYVTDLPIGITLDRYTKILTELEEKKIIETFTDFSDGENVFNFEIKCARAWSTGKSERDIIEALKLNRRITENFTCMDENNEVREFSDEIEILKAYCDIRESYYEKRKIHLVKEYRYLEEIADSKARFIGKIINRTIEPKKLTKSELLVTCDCHKFRRSYDVSKDMGYGYLINMPIHSMTTDKAELLKKDARDLASKRSDISNKTVLDFWSEDMENI
jgi:DNA topoisomerase-2